jgi:hypothetical protein
MNYSARPLIKEWQPKIVNSIQSWNKYLKVDFFKFREELKKLSSVCIEDIKNKTIVTKNTINQIMHDDNIFLYAIDDDDFVSPDLFSKVDLTGDVDCLIWPTIHLRYNLTIYPINEHIHDIIYAYTNNSILFPSGFKKLINIDPSLEFLEDHRRLDQFMVFYNFKIKKVFDIFLSVYNQSPASATMLWGWGNDPSKKGILKMVKMYQHINIPPYIQWFSKYYEPLWGMISSLTNVKLL